MYNNLLDMSKLGLNSLFHENELLTFNKSTNKLEGYSVTEYSVRVMYVLFLVEFVSYKNKK